MVPILIRFHKKLFQLFLPLLSTTHTPKLSTSVPADILSSLYTPLFLIKWRNYSPIKEQVFYIYSEFYLSVPSWSPCFRIYYLSLMHFDFFFSIGPVSPIFKYYIVLSCYKHASLTLHLSTPTGLFFFFLFLVKSSLVSLSLRSLYISF